MSKWIRWCLCLVVITGLLISARYTSGLAVGDSSEEFIYSVIGEDSVGLIKKLRLAQSSDTITIYMNTPGGSVFEGWELLKAIDTSKAKIILHVDAHAASMGALIICSKHDNLEIADDALIIFHTLQMRTLTGQTPVKTSDLPTLDEITRAMYFRAVQMMQRECRKAFTDEQWSAMWDKGENITLTGKIYKERMGIK